MISGLQSNGFSADQVLAQINRLIDQQSFMLAANDVFYASAVLFIFLIPLVWLAKPAKGGAGSDAAAGAH
jgi:DHA2 family multidrug resistance protein